MDPLYVLCDMFMSCSFCIEGDAPVCMSAFFIEFKKFKNMSDLEDAQRAKLSSLLFVINFV